jgi:hypothetical protein
VNNYPLLIEFVPGTRISRDPEVVSKLPIVQNGPPGTSVVFGDGATVPLPTDQIVFAEDGGGAARVGFGGMSFEGMEGGPVGLPPGSRPPARGATVLPAWSKDDARAAHDRLHCG